MSPTERLPPCPSNRSLRPMTALKRRPSPLVSRRSVPHGPRSPSSAGSVDSSARSPKPSTTRASRSRSSVSADSSFDPKSSTPLPGSGCSRSPRDHRKPTLRCCGSPRVLRIGSDSATSPRWRGLTGRREWRARRARRARRVRAPPTQSRPTIPLSGLSHRLIPGWTFAGRSTDEMSPAYPHKPGTVWRSSAVRSGLCAGLWIGARWSTPSRPSSSKPASGVWSMR